MCEAISTAGSLHSFANEFHPYGPATEKAIGYMCSIDIVEQPKVLSWRIGDAAMIYQTLVGRR